MATHDHDKDPEESVWIERLAKLSGRLGMSEVRVRWRLIQWTKNMRNQAKLAEQRQHYRHYNFAKCVHCSALQDKSERVCTVCGKKVRGNLLRRVGGILDSLPFPLTASSTLATIFLVVYFRMFILEPSSFWLLDVRTILQEGGVSYYAIVYGEYWRLATAIFLHAGLMHLGFNLLALLIIGPRVEEIYGQRLAFSVLLITGICGFGLTCMTTGGPSIGASGGIMGLIGLAAGWGHRDGSPSALDLRNSMLSWLLITTVFGFMMGQADHAAHIGGFLVGALLGFYLPATRRIRSASYVSISFVACVVITLASLFRLMIV